MPKASQPSTEIPERVATVEEWRRRIFSLACEMEEPLNQALAFDLMGFGLRNIADDYGPSFLAIAEAMTGQLTTAKKAWRQVMAASKHEPRRPPRPGPKGSIRTNRHAGHKKRPERRANGGVSARA